MIESKRLVERKPVATRNIKASTDNLERMLAPRTTHKPSPEVFQPGSAGDTARKKYGEWYTELMRHEWFMNGYHLGYRSDELLETPLGQIVHPDDQARFQAFFSQALGRQGDTGPAEPQPVVLEYLPIFSLKQKAG